MPTAIQRRGGTASAHTSFAGAARELTVNTDNNSVHVHDGSTPNGFELARADFSNVAQSDLDALSSSITAIFQRSETQPGTPDPSSSTPTGWYADADNVPTSSDPLWYAFGTKAAGETNFVWQTPIRAEGADGAAGADGAPGATGAEGARHAEVYMFYALASASAPTAPTTAEVSYNFSTSAASVSTSNWSTEFNPTAISSDNTANNKYWAVKVTFQEAEYDGAITETISPVFTWLNFDGLVTFTNLDSGTNENGVSTTYIDGGSIKTNSIETSALQADFIQVGNAASDINSNATTIDGGKITTDTISVNKLESGTSAAFNGVNFELGSSATVATYQAAAVFDAASSTKFGLLATNSSGGYAFGAGAVGSNAAGIFVNSVNTNYAPTHNTYAELAKSTIAGYFTDGTNVIELCNGTYAYATSGGNNGTFTAGHDGLLPTTQSPAVGDILVDTEVVAKPNVFDAITKVAVSSSANQAAAIGVYARDAADGYLPPALCDLVEGVTGTNTKQLKAEHQSLYNDHKNIVMNSVGEGLINVCGEGGDIAAGDLIVTSSTAGKGMKQSDDIVRSKTVAKAREAVTFSSPSEVQQIACIYLCG